MHKKEDFETDELRELSYSKRELLFKFIIVGDFGVGKTSIIKRYTEGNFSKCYKITIGADFGVKSFDLDDYTRVVLQLWDIAGHERFGTLTSVYYRYAVAAAIIFDLTRPETFTSVKKWLTDVLEKVSLPNSQTLPIILLANKGDITLSTLPPHISEFCRENNILSWFITSAKDNTNVDEAMEFLISTVIRNYKTQECHYKDSISLKDTPEDKKYLCCYL